ncbi:MAG: RsmB/NOP family class I SAM-dependent RNA methyltransferase [Phycisphaerales bacterium]|nr:RsmB/NOP family class I SAM-dependent RNA methyltransferase [Phycisphaerales bacterium]MDP6891341.1 RsmB/NOP family class I SAM-dependent RNA methyltransferase [Phycisphaerales bacterium]
MSHPPVTVLPEAFLARTHRILGQADVAAWEASLACPSLTVRWTGKPDRVRLGPEYLESEGFTPQSVPWFDEAWKLGAISRRVVTALDWVREQTLMLQSLSSIAAVMAMGVEPGHDVLDLCAAPGAKTSLIHRLQQGRGILVANELSRTRTRRMDSLLRRLRINDVDIRTGPGEALGGTYERCFDRVLADVPCSGEGRFHLSDSASWSRWSEAAIRGLAKRQVALLESACRTLRPDGRVLYATCTMAPEENEQVIDRVLRRGRTPIELVPADLPLDGVRPGLSGWEGNEFLPEIKHAVRVVPGTGMTPFFMASLRRVE